MGTTIAHELINKERVQRGRQSLQRNMYLDRIGQLQAKFMADQGELSFTCDTTIELEQLLNSSTVGENIQKGQDVETMHQDIMNHGRSKFHKIVNKNFVEFGIGTARGKDGTLYMVQLFRGKPMKTMSKQ